jgi:hypothetical protein
MEKQKKDLKKEGEGTAKEEGREKRKTKRKKGSRQCPGGSDSM